MERPPQPELAPHTVPFVVPLLRWLASLGPTELDALDLTASMVMLTDHTTGRQRILDDVMRPIRHDARRRFQYERVWRIAATLARRNIDVALSRNPDYAGRSHTDRQMLYDGAVDLALIRTVAHLLTGDQWEALWGVYERELPDLWRCRYDAFVFESADELETALRTPNLAEVLIIEGGVPRAEWDLRCVKCGDEFVPFGWQPWRRSACDFCRSCPTIAFIEPVKPTAPETVHFMQVFALGNLQADWPPRP